MDGIDEPESSTSVSTIRGLHHLDMAFLSEPPVASHDSHQESSSPYRPSSPHSMFQSEPGSPSGDSISSFPSATSSFHFSSGPTSPPHPGPHSVPEDEGELADSTRGLVIPSLTLPSPSRRPTPYGQTLGEVRLLLLGPNGADMSALASQLVDENEDVIEVGIWEEANHQVGGIRGKRKAVLRVSTHWIEHVDRHGLISVEPARNVELVELPAYDVQPEVHSVIEHVLSEVHSSFRQVLTLLNQEQSPSGLLAHFISAPCSPLYSALILLATPSGLSQVETALIESLSPHIPIVLLPPPTSSVSAPSSDRSRRFPSSHLSSFRPSDVDTLRLGLFRTPTTLATLRSEAAARFLRWREVERAVERLQQSARPRRDLTVPNPHSTEAGDTKMYGLWDKGAWEAQWEESLSQEVALHLRQRRPQSIARRIYPLSSLSTIARGPPSPDRRVEPTDHSLISPPCPSTFDPLHIPSLFIFSLSVFSALRTRISRSLGWQSTTVIKMTSPTVVKDDKSSVPSKRSLGYTLGMGFALVGAFCAGVGIGLVAAARF